MVKRFPNETVFISKQTGWVRVFLNPDQNHSTLMYVTDSTTVDEMVKKIGLPDVYTVWIQVFENSKIYVFLLRIRICRLSRGISR